MIEKAARRYEQIQGVLVTDDEYRFLEQQRRILEAEFRGVMATLKEEQRTAIAAYIGICAEMTERTVEIACFCRRCDIEQCFDHYVGAITDRPCGTMLRIRRNLMRNRRVTLPGDL